MDKGFRKKLLNNDKNTKKSNLSFLLNILQKFEESEQNSQVLEKLLRENVDKLEDEHLAQDLYCWTMKRLCSATPIQAQLIAGGRPEALQQAQKKLRSLTQEDIKPLSLEVHAKRQEARKKRNQHPPSSADYLKWNGEYRKYAGVTVQIDKVRNSLESEPFSHPSYWAAFTCSGLR